MFVFVYLSLVVCEGNARLSIKLELVLEENRPENVNELTRHTYSSLYTPVSTYCIYIHTTVDMLGKCKANSTQDKRLFLRLLIANCLI